MNQEPEKAPKPLSNALIMAALAAGYRVYFRARDRFYVEFPDRSTGVGTEHPTAEAAWTVAVRHMQEAQRGTDEPLSS